MSRLLISCEIMRFRSNHRLKQSLKLQIIFKGVCGFPCGKFGWYSKPLFSKFLTINCCMLGHLGEKSLYEEQLKQFLDGLYNNRYKEQSLDHNRIFYDEQMLCYWCKDRGETLLL